MVHFDLYPVVLAPFCWVFLVLLLYTLFALFGGAGKNLKLIWKMN
jgi:hypothetical protein